MSRKRKVPNARTEDSKAKRPSQAAEPSVDTEAPGGEALVRRHLRFGWLSLLFFLSMGLFLESLHGFKVGWYLEVANATRRHLWTLAHAHGTLLAVLNLLLASTVRRVPGWPRGQRSLASACFVSAAILLPAGFFVGGFFIQGGDPGLGIILVPIGGGLLFIAVLLTALAVRRRN